MKQTPIHKCLSCTYRIQIVSETTDREYPQCSLYHKPCFVAYKWCKYYKNTDTDNKQKITIAGFMRDKKVIKNE